MLGYGIIGCGYVSGRHIKAIKQLKGAELIAVADKDEKKACKVANSNGIEKWFTDYEEMLMLKEIDVVVICLPNYLHAESCIKSAKASKHIYLEKPMATTLVEASDMLQVCRENKVKLCVGQSQRFSPAYKRAKKLIEKGYLGDIFKIKGLNCSYHNYSQANRDWMKGSKMNGLVPDLAVHYVDSFRYFLAQEAIRVYAEMETFRAKETELEDSGLILIRFANKTIGELEIGLSQKMGNRGEGIEIYGNEGSLIFDTHGLHNMKFYSTKLSREIKGFMELEERPSGSFEEVWGPIHQQFFKSIIEDEVPPVTGEDGYKALEIVVAAFESARTKKAISLPLKDGNKNE